MSGRPFWPSRIVSPGVIAHIGLQSEEAIVFTEWGAASMANEGDQQGRRQQFRAISCKALVGGHLDALMVVSSGPTSAKLHSTPLDWSCCCPLSLGTLACSSAIPGAHRHSDCVECLVAQTFACHTQALPHVVVSPPVVVSFAAAPLFNMCVTQGVALSVQYCRISFHTSEHSSKLVCAWLSRVWCRGTYSWHGGFGR